ncbi:transposase [Burkholderia cenocepacia H111]|nr:transposase [Burkholderia cenocepacia H111]
MLIVKGERRFTGFDDKIIAMYARGMSVREIQGFLLEMYGIEVSPDFISTVTDAVIDEVREWQQRPLEPMYPVVFFDVLRVKIRDEGVVRNKAIYLALGVRRDGTRDVLGLWIEQTETKFRIPPPRPLPERRSRQQTTASGLAQHRKGLEDAAYHLAASSQSVRHSVRRAIHLRHQLRFLTDLSTRNS